METRLLLAATPTFQPGDVILGGQNFIEWHRADGTLVENLTGPSVTTSEHEGLVFDSSGNLYATNFSPPTIDKFDVQGNFVSTFGDPTALLGGSTGKNTIESLVFNSSGDLLTGTPDGDKAVKEIDPTGKLITTFAPAIEPFGRGTDWVELGPDQKTLYYTSEGHSVKTFNIATNTQGPDFATNLPGTHAFQLRLLPDGSMLVADSASILHLDKSGAIVKQYTAPNETDFFGVNLDPNGTSFWSASFSGKTVYKFDIASGNIVTQFNAVNFVPSSDTTNGAGIVGLVIAGQITQATTADVSINSVNPPTTGTVNGLVTFSYQITNSGPNDTPAKFSDTAPPGLSIVDVKSSQGTTLNQSGKATADLGVVPNGKSATVTVIFQVTAAGAIANTAKVTGESDPTLLDNTVTNTLNVPQPMADVAITAPTAPLTGKINDTLTKTFVVTNNGPGTAVNVTFTDPLPAGLSLVNASFTTNNPAATSVHKSAIKAQQTSDGPVVLLLGDLASGASDTVTILVKATAAGTFTNLASLKTSTPDTNPNNDSASIKIIISTPPPPPSDVAITTSTAQLTGKVGDTLTKTFLVTNHGPGIANNVTFTDPLPAGLSLVRASFTSNAVPTASVRGTAIKAQQAGEVNLSLGTLAPGASDTVTIVVRATAAGTFTNIAKVTNPPPDPNTGNDSASIKVVITRPQPPPPPPSTDGPRILSLRRLGFHSIPTRLVLTFNEALNPSTARNLDNYLLAEPVATGSEESTVKIIPINSVSYTPGSNVVTLFPSQLLYLQQRFVLFVNGTAVTGVRDTSGNLLDGKGNGHARSDYAASIKGFGPVIGSGSQS